MKLQPDLECTLTMVADAIGGASEPWWIIGSAAVALHGPAVTDIRDVDLMMGLADARRLLDRLGVEPEPDSEHPQFRSDVFGIWRDPPLPVEVFAGFRIATPEGWEAVALHSRVPATVAGRTVFVPSEAELRELLLTFARPKDLLRVRQMDGPANRA